MSKKKLTRGCLDLTGVYFSRFHLVFNKIKEFKEDPVFENPDITQSSLEWDYPWWHHLVHWAEEWKEVDKLKINSR